MVCLGTDHHPFSRLVDWCGQLAGEGWATWLVQYGHTPPPAPDSGIAGVRLLGLAELQARMREADAVVTHGGPGLIVDAHLAGHRPVVVARNPEFGEHVDSHQLRFVERVAALGSITTADTLVGLRTAVRTAIGSPGLKAPTTLAGDGASGLGTGEAAVRFGALVARMMQR